MIVGQHFKHRTFNYEDPSASRANVLKEDHIHDKLHMNICAQVASSTPCSTRGLFLLIL